MSSSFGRLLTVTLFGESHGPAVGAVIEGLPAGEPLDEAALGAFLARRRPGSGALTTGREERDLPRFLSGLYEGRTTGSPLALLIENEGQRSADYEALKNTPRPSHADYTALKKYKGFADPRGGGHFSGRLTAPLTAAGGIALQILARRGILLGAHLASVGEKEDTPFPADLSDDKLLALSRSPFPTLSGEAGKAMQEAIREAKAAGDSVGGIIECAVLHLPAGLGGPLFGGVESRLAPVLFGIPGIKGVEFGSGFSGSRLTGSQNNDPFALKNGEIQTVTNHSGGVQGGITNGMPLLFRAAVKPTPSIRQEQTTVDLKNGRETVLSIGGRHDPCIALRAVPVVEAAAALVLTDLLLEEKGYGSF